MDRPELQRLLTDIEKGEVDVVVVYKVDRLSRSLADFVRIVERLERHSVSFVSVTQCFSTTSSVGRLTLNILLSFAQFEREVIRERIRDKIAASKARGMWMGGRPPLGYDARDRRLDVNDAEAATVALIFELAVRLTARELIAELDRLGIRSKKWTSASGRDIGGFKLVFGAVRHILRNRIYIGEVLYKGNAYAGQHEPIVSRELFDRVQLELRRRSIDKSSRPLKDGGAPLTGLLFDQHGRKLHIGRTPGRGARRYRYYVAVVSDDVAVSDPPIRVRADVLDAAARNCVLKKIGMPDGVDVPWQTVREHIQRITVEATRARFILSGSDKKEPVAAIVGRLKTVGVPHVRGPLIDVLVPLCLAREKGASKLVDYRGVAYSMAASSSVQAVVKLIALAGEWRKRMLSEGEIALNGIAQCRGISVERVRAIVALAYLAPDVQRAFLSGQGRTDIVSKLMQGTAIPMEWTKQREVFALN